MLETFRHIDELCAAIEAARTGAPKLPIGLQLLRKPFGEETLLRVAHAFEQSTRWHLERPPLSL